MSCTATGALSALQTEDCGKLDNSEQMGNMV